MIAADTSAWLDFFLDGETATALQVEAALSDCRLVLLRPVLFEILSGPKLPLDARAKVLRLPLLDEVDGFWERSANLRSSVLRKGLKARSMDCLIAQSCIDHEVPLIANDRDYRHFVKEGLKLAG